MSLRREIGCITAILAPTSVFIGVMATNVIRDEIQRDPTLAVGRVLTPEQEGVAAGGIAFLALEGLCVATVVALESDRRAQTQR